MLTLVPGGMGGSEILRAGADARARRVDRGATVTAYVAGVGAGFSQGISRARRARGRRRGVDTFRGLQPSSRRLCMAARFARPGRAPQVVHFPVHGPSAPSAAFRGGRRLSPRCSAPRPPFICSDAVERAYRRRFYDAAAQRADVVVTISEFAKSRIVALLEIDPERIVVAHLGVDARRIRAEPRHPREPAALPGARLAAQEPRPVCSRRSPCCRAEDSGDAPAGAHRRRSRPPRCGASRRGAARARRSR